MSGYFLTFFGRQCRTVEIGGHAKVSTMIFIVHISNAKKAIKAQ